MNYRDFKASVALDANEPRGYEQIVFRTPDGTIYHNVTVDFGYWNNSKDKAIIVNLFNIKPKFKVGDIVCNNSGLYPNVKCTIAEVNEELEYYGYKEVDGKTYFKDQDKLMLVDNIKPKFKVGDKVKNVSSEYPDKIFVINIVNTGNECYHYFNSRSIITKFKDQDKLVLVNDEEVRPPVEDDIQLALDATIARQNIQIYNHSNYFQFKEIDYMIICASKNGFEYYVATFIESFHYVDKKGTDVKTSELVDRINRHYSALGFDVCIDKTKDVYKVLIQW